MGRRNVLFGALAVVVVAAAIILLVRSRTDAPEIGATAAYYGKCLACPFEGEVKHAAGEYAPHKCPDCAKASFYPLYYCEECNIRFVPNLVRLEPGGPLRVPDRIQCPVCNGPNCLAFIPKFVTEPLKGDAPWPDWP